MFFKCISMVRQGNDILNKLEYTTLLTNLYNDTILVVTKNNLVRVKTYRNYYYLLKFKMVYDLLIDGKKKYKRFNKKKIMIIK